MSKTLRAVLETVKEIYNEKYLLLIIIGAGLIAASLYILGKTGCCPDPTVGSGFNPDGTLQLPTVIASGCL